MTEVLERMYTLLNSALYTNCPVLSGNMRTGIKITGVSDNEVKMVIDAPFYDMKSWNAAHVILLTGAVKNGKTDYAETVNKSGAFGRHNSSEGWVDLTCLTVGQTVVNWLKSQGKQAVLRYELWRN